jgi:hypothetical protein
MNTFADFIETTPGLTDYARRMYTLIDLQAIRIGAIHAERDKHIDYRARAQRYAAAGMTWLAGVNRELADALDNDMRLAAIGSLRAWAAQPGGCGNTWLNWYVTLLKAHIEHEQSHQRQAAE